MSLQQEVQILLDECLYALSKLSRYIYMPSQYMKLPHLEEAMELPLY